jgi:RimJ/RimL family protein N-acetyltransferase
MIETPRLLLRSWCDADRDPFWAIAQDRQVMQYLPAISRRESDGTIARMNAYEAGHGFSFWAMERKSDSRFLGFCGLLPPHPPFRENEIGWRLAGDCWGQGYAREAAMACLVWAWGKTDIRTLVAVTVPANTRSRALMVRLGMTHDPREDFDHPDLPKGDPLRRHVLYRIERPDD